MKMNNNTNEPSNVRPNGVPDANGIATFLGAPALLSQADIEAALPSLDIALLGIPYDRGVTFRPGTSLGPREIRSNSTMIGKLNHQTKVRPFDLCSVMDIGDIPLDHVFNIDDTVTDIEMYVKRIVDAGTVPLSFGGDHSVSFPILKAVGANEPVALIHFDAHCDTMDEICHSKFHHGGPFRNAAEAGVIDPKRTVQIGIRGTTEELWDYSYESGMTVFHAEDVMEQGWKEIAKKTREIVGDGPVYITFDVDCLDPAYAPGTGTPEAGGLTTYQAQQLVRSLRGLNVVGGDVVEVAPVYDVGGQTAHIGANFGFELLCLLAESVDARRKK